MKHCFIIVYLILSGYVISAQNYFNNVYNDYSFIFNHPIQNYAAYNENYAYSVINTLDSNYLMIGRSECSFIYSPLDSINVTMLLHKITPMGDTIWSKNIDLSPYGYEIAYSGFTCMDSTLLLVGTVSDTIYSNVQGVDGLILKIDKNGNYLWHKHFNFGKRSKFINLKSNDGGATFNILGHADIGDTIVDYDIFYTTIDSLGNIISNYQIGEYDWDFGYDFEYMPDGSVLIAGETYSFAAGTLNRTDVYLFKIDTFGNVLWEKRYGYPGWDQTRGSQCLYVDENQNAYIAARHEKSNGDYVGWLLKTNPVGDTLWTKMYNKGPEVETLYSIERANDGNLIIMGGTRDYSYTNIKPITWLFKTDTAGNFIWERTLDKYPNYAQAHVYPSEMTLNDSGDILLTGYVINNYIETDSIFHRNDAWLCKTDSCGFTTGAKPQALFTIDSVVNGAVYVSNLSTEYCYGVFNWGDGYSSISSTYEDISNQFIFYYTDTGTFTISLNIYAADSMSVFSLPVTINTTQYQALQAQINILQQACLGGNDAIVSLNITGGIPPYSINWYGVDTAALLAGNYNYMVTDAYGAYINGSFSILAPTSPLSVDIEATPSSNGYWLEALPLGGIPPYSFSWNIINFASGFFINENGYYSVTLIDSLGCEAKDSIEIVISAINNVIPAEAGITIFPNPTDDYFIVEIAPFLSLPQGEGNSPLLWRGAGGEAKGAIYTPTGQLIQSFSLNPNLLQQRIFLNDLANGIYFVHFTYNGQHVGTERISVVR